VEAKTANGSFTVINADTGNVTSTTDATLYTQREVTYRVAGRYKNGSLTNWYSAYATDASPLLCGSVGEVDDLTVTPATCGQNAVLNWTAATSATTYDWQYSTNGGTTWTLGGSNLAALTVTDSVAHAVGSTVLLQVRPGIGTTTDGNWSNTVTVNDWGFYISSISFGNGNGTLASGDTVTVTFNRATDGTNPTGTNAQNVYVQVGAGSRGIYLGAGTNSAASSAIAFVPFSANITGTSGVQSGTAGWSAGNTVWTWTRGAAAGTALATPTWLAGNLTVGSSAANPSRVKCSDGATVLQASNPTKTGWF
jgi:hypothetical protein